MKTKNFIIIIFLIFIVFISGCIQKISEPKTMQSGLHYDGGINKIDYNSSKVIEQATLEGYAIRILKSPVGCKNPLPDGGCKGGDYIPPEYEYINVNLSDEKRSYSTMEGAWSSSPKHIGVNGNYIGSIAFVTDEFWVHILTSLNENTWFIKFVPSKEMQTKNAKEIINQEFVKLGILSEGSKINIVFEEGYVPPQLELR